MIDTLGCVIAFDLAFEHTLRPEGTSHEVHLSLAPIIVKYQGSRVTVDYPQSDYFYWSSDPKGTARLTPEQGDSLGIPRLRFALLHAGNWWHKYQYNAIREYFKAKGFDPYRYDVTRSLGLPPPEMESLGALGAFYDCSVFYAFFPRRCQCRAFSQVIIQCVSQEGAYRAWLFISRLSEYKIELS